ncbi:phosphatase [Veillonella sp. DNF00869]|uniref:Ppx/GppA phosphatase family protein n=1 Tax=Veillonella sp. DNF00869 TaxID=1384081 RepID=UPI0007819C3C|nr:phosphatase [Veillonella sp. DNF00869]KXB88786.1 Ppx/GppA phosphatase family protein [Veillonella sp. DNF00869]
MEQCIVEQGSRIGIVDLGSNSFRVLLGTYDGSQWQNEPKQLWTTQLGKRHSNGLLTEEAMERGVQALKEIEEVLTDYGATIRIGLATSAIRESGNGKDFLEKAKQACPMEYRVLSGEEEATYGFIGATVYEHPDFHYATIDVGGGSTEIALGDANHVYFTKSYPAGAVRMQDISSEGPQRVWEETVRMWDELPIEGTFGEFIGIGGTATSLAAIDLQMERYDPRRIQGHRMDRGTIEAMILQLRYMSREERLEVKGLQPGRVDIIVPGAEIITSLMDTYQIGSIVVSEADGLEGWQAQYGAK